ncbi:Vanadium chloroperoxidase [Gracilariopsis chorda]|uniref:Vanadium chloroperoxidase n=1 Tax=Gracilariopsis chorda TaxID=448386 RepID=A0A2V3IQJ3_9FLOR|nr:Vanadium chloroperoxidase [Gracilariopsis chorda]|eukprot:PXF44366.1 Vanadium chloroperoxidase [Gracilariopsis chorda]
MKILQLVLVAALLLWTCSATYTPKVFRPQSCSSTADCPFSPFVRCIRGSCKDLRQRIFALRPVGNNPAPVAPAGPPRNVGNACQSIRDCDSGLVCVDQNPGGRCEQLDGMIGLASFVVNLIQEDYSPPSGRDPDPDQGGPTRTSRAMAIIFLAAHDAFATVTGEFKARTRLRSLRIASKFIRSAVRSLDDDEVEKEAVFAMQAAALTAAKLLYPSRRSTIDPVLDAVTEGARSEFVEFGETFGEQLFKSRLNDGSQRPQLDDEFEIGELLRHQPDPNFPIVENDPNAVQRNFGRFWGEVTPFAIRDVERDAFLGPFPELPSREYRENLEEVTIMGECNEFTNDDGILLQDIGIFWGYDGAPRLGTPPRLFLQTVLAIDEVQELSLPDSVRAITAVGVSMADAGIAAWYWKFFYDLWRPTSGVRNDTITPDPDWDPRGLPLSNLDRTPRPPECVGLNPDFPAYPSGHATFGAAAFFTIAKVLGKEPKDVVATITSDEFNGRTTEGTTGEVRRVFTQTIDLQEAIDQNNAGRVYLGVHWRFDSDGGELVGKQISEFAARQFRI